MDNDSEVKAIIQDWENSGRLIEVKKNDFRIDRKCLEYLLKKLLTKIKGDG